MAGCSKNNPQLPPEDAWIDDLSLPVPIQFGTSSMVTKATPIDNLDSLKGRIIGILGIDKRSEADWSSSDSESILLNNVQGTYDVDDNGGGYIQFKKGPYYYPMNSTQNFTFYGYYIHGQTEYQTDDEGELRAGGYYVPVDIGHTDLLWAKAEAEGEGYNSQYIRGIRKSTVDDDMPTFDFRHVTAGLEFWAYANLDGIYTDDDFTNIVIRQVYVENAITKAQLCVAHKDDVGTEEGSGAYEGKLCNKDESTRGRIATRNATWMSHNPKGDGERIGNDLFLYPGEEYTVYVVIHSGQLSSPRVDTLKINTPVLEAGRKLRYNLMFNKMEEVRINVGSVSWPNTSDDDIKDINVEEELKTGSE